MRSTDSLPAGLYGNCTAADLRVGDRVVVTRAGNRARVVIQRVSRDGATVVFAYRVIRTGQTGSTSTAADSRWTKLPDLEL